MKAIHLGFIISILFTVPDFCISQENELEKLLEQETEYSDQSDLLERVLEYKQNPININYANLNDFTVLPWISAQLANDIITYRSQNGHFLSLEELLNVHGFSEDTFEKVYEYLTITHLSYSDQIKIRHRSRLTRKLEKSIGYQEGTYYNSPNKYYNRFNIKYDNKIDAGVVFEKDSGEQRLNDLSLYYLKYSNPTKNYNFIIGNYLLEFGQGLTFWNPYGYRKSSNPVYSAFNRERNVLGYQMVDENASLFGVSSQICLKIYQLLIYFSRAKLDASQNSDGFVTSFYQSGYHRTSTEIEKKDVLQEQLIGGRFVVTPSPTIKFGTTAYRSVYDKPIKNKDIIRNRFNFSGSSNYVYSTDFDMIWRNFRLFGEFAQSKSKGWGLISGTSIKFNPLNFLILYRNYSKNFHSLHGSGFGERGGSPANEHGFYYGVKYRFFKKASLAVYYDIYKYPWRTYFENLPVAGNDLLCQIEYKLNSATLITIRYKTKNTQKSDKTTDLYGRIIDSYFNQIKHSLRLQLDYKPISNLKLRGRFEQSNFTLKNQSTGILIYQDIKYKYSQYFTLYSRITFFDTDDYDSRVYQFENDVPHVLTNQMLYGKGNRWYICMIFNIMKLWRFGVKYSVTNYEYVDSIGSAQDKILGNSIRSFNIQIETNY